MSAGEFEGLHQGQRRGSGAVIIWDEGTARIVRDEAGHISFILAGHKLSGGFALTRTGDKRWILVKVRDEQARPGSDIVTERPESVRSGRTWQELRERSESLPRRLVKVFSHSGVLAPDDAERFPAPARAGYRIDEMPL